jgi:hypothetical protein
MCIVIARRPQADEAIQRRDQIEQCDWIASSRRSSQ